jgi:hypothetical protein
MKTPAGYFLTFGSYGAHLHGDPRGSAHGRGHFVGKNDAFAGYERRAMWQDAVTFDHRARAVIVATTREVCAHRSWTLYAVHARTEHVHVVVGANATPERVMSDVKAWSTRRLVEAGLFERGARVWARHGSTRYLWTADAVGVAGEYVLMRQGEPMARWPEVGG